MMHFKKAPVTSCDALITGPLGIAFVEDHEWVHNNDFVGVVKFLICGLQR